MVMLGIKPWSSRRVVSALTSMASLHPQKLCAFYYFDYMLACLSLCGSVHMPASTVPEEGAGHQTPVLWEGSVHS